VQRGTVGPMGPPELAALPCPRRIPRVLLSILLLLSPCSAVARRLLPTRCHSAVHGSPIAPRAVVSGPCASTVVTTRCARAPMAPIQTEKPPKPLETTQRPRAATPREGAWGDLGDPSGRRKTPSGQPRWPIDGARGLGWRAGTARHATPRSPTRRGRQRQKPSCRGQKTKQNTEAPRTAHIGACGHPNAVRAPPWVCSASCTSPARCERLTPPRRRCYAWSRRAKFSGGDRDCEAGCVGAVRALFETKHNT
jgi:hypothetical protein